MAIGSRFILAAYLFLACHIHANEHKTVCLNMIVKNESHVIERCLGSVKGLIDYWVIFDTGSTDGTQDLIKAYLKDIPGELHESPWVNFAHNRNEALQAAKNKADYLLFIDADEIWEYANDFSLPQLDKDCYYTIVRQLDAVDFRRVGLVNNHLDWRWEGVLHEVVQSNEAKTFVDLEGVMNICNAAQGARSHDPNKYIKDALVLEEALLHDPDNSRDVFYLAQSYFAAGKYEQALLNYKKRAAMTSSNAQETYLAQYNVGQLQEQLGQPNEALVSFFKAFEMRPSRAEPLLRAAILYRKMGNYLLGYLLSKHALTIPYPKEDFCIEYMAYDYTILVELANCALLLGKFEEGHQICSQLLEKSTLPEEIRVQVLKNKNLAEGHITQLTP